MPNRKQQGFARLSRIYGNISIHVSEKERWRGVGSAGKAWDDAMWLARRKIGEKNLSIIARTRSGRIGFSFHTTYASRRVIDICRGSHSSRDRDSSCESSNKRPAHDATVSTRIRLMSHLDRGPVSSFQANIQAGLRRNVNRLIHASLKDSIYSNFL